MLAAAVAGARTVEWKLAVASLQQMKQGEGGPSATWWVKKPRPRRLENSEGGHRSRYRGLGVFFQNEGLMRVMTEWVS